MCGGEKNGHRFDGAAYSRPVRRVWRSRFGNILLFLVMLSMAGLSATGLEAFVEPRLPWAGVWFAFQTLVLLVGAVRALRIGVVADADGIVVRGLTHTRRMPWAEISEITLGGAASGASGSAGIRAPLVSWARPGRPVRRVELRELGGYGPATGRTLAERAVAELNEHLAAWRVGVTTSASGDAAT